MTLKVNETTQAVQNMQPDWQLVTDLLGGTRAMRKAGEQYLPRRLLEEPEDHKARLNVATLHPAFIETITKLTGRVFAEPLKLGDDIPSWMTEPGSVTDNIDMQGRNIHVFARELFETGISYGLTHVLVDSPPLVTTKDGVETPVVSLEDQKKANIRPYAVHIKPQRILGWKVANGVLTQLRISACRLEPDGGEFGESEIEQVLVYEPGKMTEYEKDAKGDWQPAKENMMALDYIPFATFYTKRTDFMQAVPPLRELAFLNVKHWSQQSDNDELIKTASVPILVEYGGGEQTLITIGAKSAIKMPADGKLEYTEHSGKAIDAGRGSLDSLKDEMKDAGAKLLQKGTGRTTSTKTAAQINEEAAADNSALGTMVEDFSDFLEQVLLLVAQWRGENEGGTVEPQPNLDPDMSPIDSGKLLLDLANSDKLSDATLFNEIQKRGLISEDITWEDEQARIKLQPPTLPPPVAPKLDANGNPLPDAKPVPKPTPA